MTKETPKDKNSKVPAWISAALKKKQTQSYDSFDNSSKDLGQKSSKPKSNNSNSGPVIPHRPQR